MTTKRLQVQHDTKERKFVATWEPRQRDIDVRAELIADQEQKWGEPRLPTND